MSAGFQKRAPRLQTGIKADHIDRTFAPDQIERAGRKVQIFHVADLRHRAVGGANCLELPVQLVDERRMIVNRDDRRRRVLGECSRLRTSASAEIEDPS